LQRDENHEVGIFEQTKPDHINEVTLEGMISFLGENEKFGTIQIDAH